MRPALPPELGRLVDLVVNLRWSWHPETQDLFEAADPRAWEDSGHDPVRFLGRISTERLAALAADEQFRERLDAAAADLDDYRSGDRWYHSLGTDSPRRIAYFSPEFGISTVLPQYSGGLGILAGDHLKTASDLGVPILGVGLLYRHGYFRQVLTREGWQQETYPVIDPDELPLSLLRDDGSPVQVSVTVPGGDLRAHVWIAQVGRVPLLLLDSDTEDNVPSLRDVTDRLYGGGSEHRLLQEVLLGIGGIRAIRAYCRISGTGAPEVFHTNEGHAGFLGLERIREFVEGDGFDFDAALERARAGTVFTTHTPVPAGIDRFARDLVEEQFSSGFASAELPIEKILALGAEEYDGGDPDVFNMAVMGFRLAGRANAVSKLHGEVSRRMFAGLWPAFEQHDIPIHSITNGVHAPTWVAREVLELAERESVLSSVEESDDWAAVDQVPSRLVWETKAQLRARLVEDVRRRVRESWLERGATSAELGWVDSVLDPEVLTIGFARRVPTYKRLTLMLADAERLQGLLLHPERPIQIVIAGKAHPADDTGKKLIQEIVKFSDDPAVRHRIVFLPNYDISLALAMVPGCDVWLNNPLRPYEACGTSGMKSALNGGLNLSVRDGWWDELFDGGNGWAIPSAEGIDDPERRDAVEAAALYDLVEKEIAPRFYDLGDDGLPLRWIEMVRHTLKSLGPRVLASRMVRDYVREMYTPAARIARRLDEDPKASTALAQWKQRVRDAWPAVRIDHVEAIGVGEAVQLGTRVTVRADVSIDGLGADDIQVQLLHGRVSGDDELRDVSVVSMAPVEAVDAELLRFEADVAPLQTGPFGYTVRVCPQNDLLASPADVGVVTWPPEPSPLDPT